jgi:hypothetical protein
MLVTGLDDCFSIKVKAIAAIAASSMPHLKTPDSPCIFLFDSRVRRFRANDMRQSSARLLHNDTVNGSNHRVAV